MRYRHLLLEYSREKTLQNWRMKLRHRLSDEILTRTLGRDHDVWREANNYYVADHAKGIPEETLAKNDAVVMSLIEAADPTPNKEYVQWIVQRYVSGGITRWEDLGRVYETLWRFHNLKKSGYFKRNPGQAKFADIGQFKDLRDLGVFIRSLSDDDFLSITAQERAIEAEMIEKGEAIVLADTDVLKVVIPRTHKAACWWGKNTQWCTAARDSPRAFDIYNQQGPLYVVLQKETNRRWQLHFESAQFMDETDAPIELWSRFPMEAFDAIDIRRVSDEGKFATLTEPSDSGEEFPDEIMIKMAQSCGQSVLAAAILGSAEWAEFTKMIVEALPGRPTFDIVTRKNKNGAEVEILDYRTDVLSFLRHNWKDLKDAQHFIWHAMGVRDDHGKPDLKSYWRGFSGNSHIISFRDENRKLTHAIVNRGKITVIEGIKVRSGFTQIIQRSKLEDQLNYLRAKNETKMPNYDAALMYILRKAEMLDEDGNLPPDMP